MAALTLAVLSRAAGATAVAGPTPLSWETTERTIVATPGQEIATCLFPFRNVSDRPVQITSVNTGCVCTTAIFPKKSYAPGESGELKIEFTLGDRVGRQERLMHVTTDAPDSAPATIKLVVEIPELALARPRLLFWKVGDPLDAKTVEITLMHPATSQLSTPTSTNSIFSARVHATPRPGIYRVEIKPSATHEPVHGVIHLPAIVEGKSRVLSVFTAVK